MGIFYICIMRQIKIAVHGGAGTMPKRLMTPEIEKACHDALQNALQAGYDLMKNGGSAFDAVEAAIIILENFELFNAGKGAVFTHDGKHEMDASIMDGKTLRSGAVAAVNILKTLFHWQRLLCYILNMYCC